MTSNTRSLALAALAGLTLVLSACSGTAAPDAGTADPSDRTSVVVDAACDDSQTGVTLIVDASVLDLADDPSATWCVVTDEPVDAADALADAAIEVEGTTQYPDDLVCRVAGAPSEETDLVSADGTVVNETCTSMPPAFAYWSLWVKPANGEWGYAQEGLATLQLSPGDSLELLFQLDGEPAVPAS